LSVDFAVVVGSDSRVGVSCDDDHSVEPGIHVCFGFVGDNFSDDVFDVPGVQTRESTDVDIRV